MSCLKKSFSLIALLLCCISIDANAQVLHFGAKVGLNLADLYGFEMPSGLQEKQEVRPGFVVGVYITHDIIPSVSIQPEVLYSMKGTKVIETSPTSADYVFSYDYVEVPVLLKVNLPIGSAAPFRANVFAGPDFASNVAAYEKVTIAPGIPGPPSHSVTFDQKPSTRSFDFNLAVGAGAGYDIGVTTLGFEVRYTFATSRLNKLGPASERNGVFSMIASVGI